MKIIYRLVVILLLIGSGWFILSDTQKTSLKAKLFQKSEQQELLIQIPKVHGKLPSGQSVAHHWEDQGNRFVFVAGKHVRVYSGPSKTDRVVGWLNYSERVRVVFVKPVVEQDKKKEVWAFVVDEFGENPLGWVLNRVLAYQNMFNPISEWDYEGFNVIKGDYFGQYKTALNGRYVNQFRVDGQDLHFRGIKKGVLLSYENLIWAKKERYSGWEDFFLLDEETNQLKQEWKFKTEPIKAK